MRAGFRLYALAMTAAAAVVLAWLVRDEWAVGGDPLLLCILAACVVAAELVPLRLPRADGLSDELTLSAAFALALTLLFGPAAGVAVYAFACLVAEVVERPAFEKSVFNVAQSIVTMGAAAAAFTAVSGHTTLASMSGDAVAVVAMAAVFFAVDNVSASIAFALLSGVSPVAIFREHLTVHTWTEASLLALAPVVVATAREATWLVPLLAVPMAGILIGGRQAIANWRRALYDDATGLPNRVGLLRRLDDELATVGSGGGVCVCVVTVDGLKAVGDALGAGAADSVLALASERLTSTRPAGYTLARVGPAQFGATAVVRAPAAVRAWVETAFAAPFEVADLSIPLRAYAGVARSSATDRATDLLGRASAAADRAAAERIAVVEAPPEDELPIDRLVLAGQLQRGIAAGELLLEYQPKQALHEGLDDAVEALVRWNHPSLGPLSPQAFIPLAEQTGLIGALTRWVASAAIRQCSEWREAGLRVRVAINVSARDVIDRAFADHLESLLDEFSLPAELLQLEVTESQLLGESAEAEQALGRLARRGVAAAIDDFGTGYSSLAQLQRLEVDEIKIDRSFVADLDLDGADAAIVRSTVDLAKALGLRVTAEGVETATVLSRLVTLGCDYAQGFHIGRPMSAAACREAIGAAGSSGQRRFRQAQLRPAARRASG